MVRVKPGQSSRAVASDAGAQVVSGAARNTFLLAASKQAAALAKLGRDPRVEYAEPNVRFKAFDKPNDPCIDNPCSVVPGSLPPTPQWGLARIDAFNAWSVSKGSADVLVAVLDSGVDATHEEFAATNKIVTGPNHTTVVGDDCGHGTHVAGVVTAQPNNGKGVAGVGWNTRVLSIKVLAFDPNPPPNGDCTGSLFAISQGINDAVQMGAKVINLSLGGPSDTKSLRDSVSAAQKAGLLVVAAAGNEGQAKFGNPVEYPAAYPGVISVAATGSDDHMTFYSERGTWVTMAAPGDYIVSTVPGGYEVLRGTSMASPHVAAAAGLLFGAFPGTNSAQVASRLELSSDDILGAGVDIRYGRLNLFRALTTTGPGYWMTASDGGVFSFGESQFYGSTGSIKLNQPIVAMAATPRRRGYWFVAKDGGIFSYGDAQFFGSKGGEKLPSPIAGMAALPDGLGYVFVAADGTLYRFGAAETDIPDSPPFRLSAPVVGVRVTPSGHGLWVVCSDGAVFSVGDGGFFGSMGGQHLNKPVVGMTTTPSGQGYWLVASDGGMFSFGDAAFFGSMGGRPLNQPIVGMQSTPSGLGYWLVASDGGMFSFGDAQFFGSMGGIPLNKPVVGMG